MKTTTENVMRLVFIFLFLCGFISFSISQTNAKDWTETQKEVWTSAEAYWESCKQGDEKAVMDIHHDDCVIWLATRKLPADKYNIRLLFRPWITGPEAPASYELEPLSINVFGDVAIVYYTYTWGMKKKPSSDSFFSEQFHSGRTMQTFVKQNNKWLLIGHMNALY